MVSAWQTSLTSTLVNKVSDDADWVARFTCLSTAGEIFRVDHKRLQAIVLDAHRSIFDGGPPRVGHYVGHSCNFRVHSSAIT